MKNYFYLILFVLPLNLMAQKTINGNVTSTTGLPLPGASVIVKGTSKGAVTDFDGNFSIAIDGTPATLSISYLGYKNNEVVVNNETSLSIVLEEDTSQLDEVVVIGYGQVDKKDLSGSVSTIKEDKDIAMQYTDVGSLLQGRTSGVQVTGNTGAPGAGVSVRIRGTNSLRGNNEPLYVVDGVIINSAGADVANATNDVNEGQQTQNGLTGINPRDIESVEVLKDASATSIYGSRGANGVIIITTKKGANGKPTINVYGSTTIANVTNTIDVLSPIDFARYRNELSALEGSPDSFLINGNQVSEIDLDTGEISDPLRQTNWQDEIFRQAFSNIVGLDISGADDKNNYYISGNIGEQKGNIPRTFLNTANFRVNHAIQASERLNIKTRLALYFGRGSMNQGSNSAGGNRSFVRQLIGYNPLDGGTISDADDFGRFNPYSFIEDYEEKIKEKRINFSINATYEISDALKYQLRAGGNHRTKFRSRWYGTQTFKGELTDGNLSLSELEATSFTLDNLLLYNKRFNENHRLNGTFGISYDGNRVSGSTYEVGQFPIKALRELAPEGGEVVLSPYTLWGPNDDNIFSVIARAIYTLKNRYTFTGTFRSDSSSKFGNGSKTGYFPSLAFSWRANQEPFLRNSKTINDLKLRASWGRVGNQGIRPYETVSRYSFEGNTYSNIQNQTVVGTAPVNLANPDLTWETTEQLNFGVDFSLFNSFFNGSIDLYKKDTKDLLITLPAPPSTGFSSIIANRGGMENKGMDISLDFQLFNKEDFKWSIGGNLSLNRNKITNLGGLAASNLLLDGELVQKPSYQGGQISTGAFFNYNANIFIEGQPIGLFWGLKTDGIYADDAQAAAGPTFFGNDNQAGDVAFIDQNGDGNVNDGDATVIGNPNPDYTYGFNTNLTYKNFDLSMLFTGSQGNDIVNGNLITEQATFGNSNIRSEAYFNAWTPENTNAAFPRLGSNTSTRALTDRLVQDGSFLRLRNVTISYTLDSQKDNALFKSCKIYVSGNNLFTITKYNGYDPELTNFLFNGSIIGVDWNGTPNVRSFVLGANIKL